MNEAGFRSLMREAVGEEEPRPWLAHAVRTRVTQPERRTWGAPWLAIAAVFVVLALLAVAIAPRLLHRGLYALPQSVANPQGIDPSNCTLPVIVYDQIPGPDKSQPWQDGSQAAKLWGFVSTRTGRFQIDPSASPVRGMPVDPVYDSSPTAARIAAPPAPALSYSAAVKRWLPVAPERVSPDGLSYAFLGDLQATTLMRYDIETGQILKLWDAGFQIGIIRWTASGILVSAAPGSSRDWLVDPVTGAHQEVQPASTVLPPPSSGANLTALGTTSNGDVIHEQAILNGATVTIWVYYDTAGGKRFLIYHGTGPTANVSDVNGVMWHKGTGFDPGTAVSAGAEIWFSTFAPSFTLWHWDQTRGLGHVDIALVDPYVLESLPAGPCF